MKYAFLLLWRQAIPLLLFPTLFVALCFGYFLVASPTYTSSALIRVDTESALEPKELDAVLASYIETINSDEVTAAVIERLELGAAQDVERGLMVQVIGELRQKYGLETYRGMTDDERETLLIEWVRSELSAKRVRETSILEIKYSADSPDHAAKVANSYADAFVEHQARIAEAALENRLDFVRRRLEELRRSIETSQQEAQTIKSSDGGEPGGFENLENRISQLTLQLSEVDQTRAGLAEQIILLKKTDDLRTLEAAASKVEGGRQLFQAYFDLQKSLDRQNSGDGGQSPKGQLAAAADELRAELVRIRDQALIGLEQEYKVATAKRETIANKLRDAHVLINSTDWSKIQSAEHDTATFLAIYADYLREIEVARKTANEAPVSLMTAARADPNPSWPDYKILLLLSACAGLGIGCVIAYLREWRRAQELAEKKQSERRVASIVPLMEIWSNHDLDGTDEPDVKT